jgi:hypothetical protein
MRYRLLPQTAAAKPQIKIADIYEEALAGYDVRPYRGELTLFLAELHLAGFHNHLGGWGELAQDGVPLFSLRISPRGSLVEPYVGQLAASCVVALTGRWKIRKSLCTNLAWNSLARISLAAVRRQRNWSTRKREGSRLKR